MPVITVEDIAFVRYEAPDLDRMEAFLGDFGLSRAARTDDALYMRCAGPAHHVHVTHRGPVPRSVGLAFRAASADDLTRLADHVGVEVEALDEPGGGLRVRLKDPAGFLVDVIHGQAAHLSQSRRVSHACNTVDRRERLGQVLRVAASPSQVMRLGHAVLLVPDFDVVFAFYRDLLGLVITDSYHMEDPSKVSFAFLRCGLGERYTDHHTLAIGVPPGGLDQSRFDHVAFEVTDLDDLMTGQHWLQARGWTHSWGVGRHVQGSQLFDYWRDPFGNKIEHWTDGDLVNDRHAPSHHPLNPAGLAQWAPPLTPEFFE